MRNNNFTGNRVDTGTLLRIGGSRRDTETWKFKIIDWFKREGITTNENKYSYIITAVEDDIVRILMEKEKEVNRALTLDECVKLIKKKYWRENLKEDKLRQLKKIIITPNESVLILILDFWNYTINWISTISLLYQLLIMKMHYNQEVEYMKWLL